MLIHPINCIQSNIKHPINCIQSSTTLRNRMEKNVPHLKKPKLWPQLYHLPMTLGKSIGDPFLHLNDEETGLDDFHSSL